MLRVQRLEYAFGLFVFLVMLLATSLVFVSLLVDIPGLALLLLLGLPLLFYMFSFVDLARSIGAKRGLVARSQLTALIFVGLAVAYQLFSPNAPTSFCIMNRPEIFVANTSIEPEFQEGDLLAANKLSYVIEFSFLNFPIIHRLPLHYEAVRFIDSDGNRLTGVVIGQPGQLIEIVDGDLLVDGVPKYQGDQMSRSLVGNWPLTAADANSILIATLSLGRIENVHQVRLGSIVGRVERIL